MFAISTAIIILLFINLECYYSCHVTVVDTIMFTAVVLPPCTLPLSRHRARRFTLSSGHHVVANNERAVDRKLNRKGVDRDSSVGIATRFGLFGPGILPDLLGVPPSVSYNGYRVTSLGEVRPGRGVDHAPPCSAEVKETVELHVCSPLGLHGLLKLNFNFYSKGSYVRPPLWSSGQSFWLQIQRSRVRFPALPDFLSSSGSGTGSTQPRDVN